MNRIFFNIFLISFLTVAPFLSNSQTLDKNQVDALKDSLTRLINYGEYIGVSIAIVNKDSIIWTGGLGKYDIKQNQPVNENTLFWLGSVTKSFTALAIMKMVEENKFFLNTRLNDILPEIEIENKWEMTNPVTIENLLEHTSGFDDMHFSAFANVYHEVLSPLEQIRKYRKSFISRWEPSTRFSYSNANYALLGYIIYKLTGIQYEEYVK
jgi:CubicO group peptidase (beta-lactamase class C family)